MSMVGIGPDCLPNRELSLLFGRLTLGHSLVGREVELVQGNLHFAFLRSVVFVSSPAPYLRTGVLWPPSRFPSEVDRLQIRV